MKIYNVIVSDDETGIVAIDSFAVVESQFEDDVREEAEDQFRARCNMIKFDTATPEFGNLIEDEIFSEEEIDDFCGEVENAISHFNKMVIGSQSVSLVVSYAENIQE